METYITQEQILKQEQAETRGLTLYAAGQAQQDAARRTGGKILMVYGACQHNTYVPGIRVAGIWLKRFGFSLGDKVTLQAEDGKITIRKAN